MSDIAIRVENLGKQYHIGGKRAGQRTFREALLDTFASPIRWMRGERKAFETFWALDDVSFEIKQGEAVGIIGRNGAGKSTLLKILSRITKPTRGRVELYGRVASLLEVGTGFHSELSGRDNIYLNGAILGMSRREINQKFDEIVDFSGVERFLDTPVKHYSSGMYVRLAFAVAAHLEPEILVVDEVLAVGDAEFQKKSLGKMNDAAQKGRTVLFVSHNMGSILQLTNQCILLDRGRVISHGNSSDVIHEYGETSKKSGNFASYAIEENKHAQITEITVTSLDHKRIESHPHTEPFLINLKYQVEKWPIGSYICLDVFNETDVRILWSADVAKFNELTQKRTAGEYEARIRIPENVLAPGHYYFTIAIYAPGHSTLTDVKDKAVSVEIIDNGTFLSHLGIKHHAATVIALDWNSKKL
ncbi:MAG: ABC transporter ATP-binding protein [Chloroflexi bacterium]|nr:ABC transporter ATP-binding protein [Chloroflexota bacterium]